MRKLYKFLIESINIFEANEAIQHFMVEYDSVNKNEGIEEYFKNRGLLKDGKIYVGRSKEKYFVLDDFKKMYEYADEHNMPCPVIVNYKNKNGHFVLRRWVSGLNEEFEHVDVISDKGAPFDGLHNTNMKEDGRWFPSAQDMESIICFAYNKYHGLFKTDEDNILYVTGQEPVTNSKAEQLMEYYTANVDNLNQVAKALPSNVGKLMKLPGKNKVSKEWYELGAYGQYKPNVVPKTDIYSNDSFKISLKKFGGSQLMSAYEQEARATLYAAAEAINDESIKEKLNKLFEVPWLRNINSQKDIEKRTDAQKLNRQLTIIFKELMDNKEYKKAVMMEAASGLVKFGNSSSTANCVFVWDIDMPKNCKFYKSIEEYVDRVLDSAQVIIALKTTTTTSTALRIITD